VSHGRRKNAGDNQSAIPVGRFSMMNFGTLHPSGQAELLDRNAAVECIETESERQEERELQNNNGGVEHEGPLTVPARFAAEEALHEK